MKNFAQLLLCFFAVALFTSCEDDISKRQAVFTATMPTDDLSSGKTCSFELVLPKSVKPDRDYEIIGVTGVEA